MRRILYTSVTFLFSQRNYLIKNTGMLWGDNSVLMEGTEIPFFIVATIVNFLNISVKLVYAVDLSLTKKHRTFYKLGGFVRYNIIYLKSCFIQLCGTLRHFGRCGKFFLPI